MKKLFTFLLVTLIGVTGLFAQAPDAGDADFVAEWATPLPTWFAPLPATPQVKKMATTTAVSNFDAAAVDFDAEWAKIPGDGNVIGEEGSRLGLAASDKGDADFNGSFKVLADESYIYILLQYEDDDVTGNETVEVAWAPYDSINAPKLETLPQAWFARYIQFGAYKASFKNTGFDAAMMIDGSVADGNTAINWGGTNDILSANLFLDDHTAIGSNTVKQIISIGFACLTGDARPEFNTEIWKMINGGKGISLDMKVNDVDTDDALNTDDPAVQKPAEYWWNAKNNDCYALTAYAGHLEAPAAELSGDAAYVADWKTPLPTWFAQLPAEEQEKKQASAVKVASFDAVDGDFDAEWAKISGDGNVLGAEGSRLGLAASDKGDADFKGAYKVAFDDANMYILLKYDDDDITGNETAEVAWAPYYSIDAPVLEALPQAWYARYIQFGAYKATFKNTGFDAAMMIDGSVADANTAINWGGTNDILSANLFLDDHTTVGANTVKQIITVGFACLTGDARPEFNEMIWAELNEGKGISFDLKINDVDTDDALNDADPAVQKPAEYWWNSKHNDSYALTAYAGFLKPTESTLAGDAAYVANWLTPLPTWFAKLPAEEQEKKQASAAKVASFDAVDGDFDAEWAKISGDGNVLGAEGSRLGLAASDKGDADFKGAYKVAFDDANMYILLKFDDDDITGNETAEVAWAPYYSIDAPVLEALPQAWYARYIQFGAYKATFKNTGFDAAMMIDGSVADANTAINWGGTNDILSANLFLDDHTTVGSNTVKQIITIGFACLTGDARPEFNEMIWAELNDGKGISFDLKINDVDTDDALNTDDPAVQKPAEYWWNSKHNDSYALTAYAGFLDTKGVITSVRPVFTEASIFGNVSNYKIQLTKTANVAVYNTLGQQLKALRGVNEVDIADLKSGIYIIRANNEVKKLYKQ